MVMRPSALSRIPSVTFLPRLRVPWATRPPSSASPLIFSRNSALPPQSLTPRPPLSSHSPFPSSSPSFPLSSHALSLSSPPPPARSLVTPSPAPMSTDAAAPEAEVFGRRQGNAAIAILNRPKALNSLNHNMVHLLKGLLEEWEKDPSVNLVIVKSEGRAFCAGGDVRTCVELGKKGEWLKAADFFYREYELDYLVASYKKPYIPLINGIVMGGGNGISMHAPFRVVTEKVLFAMPETLIGLHPDVGASYFLPRLPGFLGEYLALTGVRLKAADMVACGLATHGVPSERLPALEERLCALRVPDLESISLALDEFADAPHVAELVVVPKQALVDKHFRHETVEGIVASLEASAAQAGAGQSDAGQSDAAEADAAQADASEAQWCSETLEFLKRMSPTSMKVSLRSVREGRHQSLAECLEKETRLSYRCVEQTTSPDFYEGVRALLIDKDNNPKFSPTTLQEVTQTMIDKHFEPFLDPTHELRAATLLRQRGGVHNL